MNDHHTKVIQDLQTSIQEARRIKNNTSRLTKDIVSRTEEIRALIESMKIEEIKYKEALKLK